jgi:hypothetical protein
MDASDLIRKYQTQANYGYYLNKMMSTQPSVNLSTNIGALSTIKIVYPSYEERQRIAEGLYTYTTVSTLSTLTIVPPANSGNVRYVPKYPRYDAPII